MYTMSFSALHSALQQSALAVCACINFHQLFSCVQEWNYVACCVCECVYVPMPARPAATATYVSLPFSLILWCNPVHPRGDDGLSGLGFKSGDVFLE